MEINKCDFKVGDEYHGIPNVKVKSFTIACDTFCVLFMDTIQNCDK